MPGEVRLVPYEEHMGPNFVPYEVIEAELEASATKKPEPGNDAETPAPAQPE
ncbi:MAG: hypothetical protein KBD27_01985 [Candidatus Moranbacteria bacterium]|nr:hypothetical protein [Candidatus Moranbacteria bacterium]